MWNGFGLDDLEGNPLHFGDSGVEDVGPAQDKECNAVVLYAVPFLEAFSL